jgi:DNA-binding beta-propeller fold protein YncE
VFVTGQSEGKSSGADYATVAYSAATGARRWVSRYSGPGNGKDAAISVVASSGRVFVTGRSAGTTKTGTDYATVAYSAATGAQLWASRYSAPGTSSDVPAGLAVSQGLVFVTGQSDSGSSISYATVAYSAVTGAQLWVSQYGGTGDGPAEPSSIAVSPAGGLVYVTGLSYARASGYDYATIAYSAATGAEVWLRRYRGPGRSYDDATAVAVSPAGGRVYVTGVSSDDYVTVGYNATSGAQVWASRYNGPHGDLNDPTALAVSPTTGTIFVTGESRGATSGFDYATVAYRG